MSQSTYFQSCLESLDEQKYIKNLNQIIVQPILRFNQYYSENIQNMNYLSNQFEALRQKDEDYVNNLQTDTNCFAKNAFLFHALKYMLTIKSHLAQLPEDSGLNHQKLKNIRLQDTALMLSRKIGEKYQEMIRDKQGDGQLLQEDVLWLVLRTFKWQFFATTLFYMLDALFRICFSVVILYVFEAVQSGTLGLAYGLIAVLILLWYLSQLSRQTAFIQSYYLASHIKASLAMLLFSKISKTTSFVIKSSELGKITNLLSNDLTIIQTRLITILWSLAFPVTLIGITTLLIIRLGWVAIVGIVIVLLQIPIANKISQINGEIVNEANEFKDSRVQITSEIIEGIKYVKLYGWELAFKKIVQDIREKQIYKLKKLALGRAFGRALAQSIGFIGSLVMFVLAEEVNHALSFILIFTTLEIVANLRQSMLILTFGVGLYYEVKVVCGRFASIFNIKIKTMISIEKGPAGEPENHQNMETTKHIRKENWHSMEFLYHPQTKSNRKGQSRVRSQDILVQFNSFNGFWKDQHEVPALKNISYCFQPGKIYGIAGKVGSGKSGLLGAILKEIPYYSGQLKVQGRISYVEQEPVVFSETIFKNILFGSQFDQQQYDKSIEMSCLKQDFEILDDGDQTIVGEKGITLSGGQKARLALARAIYADGDIFILDDPISAVDAKVAKKIFEECIKVLSRTKVVILVTHQIGYIEECDEAIIMEDGSISSSGKPDEMKRELLELIQVSKKGEPEEKVEEDQDEDSHEKQLDKNVKTTKVEEQSAVSERETKKTKKNAEIKNRFTEKDAKVSFSTYKNFLLSSPMNYVLIPLTVLLFLVSQGIVTVYYRFLADFDNVKAGTSGNFGGNFRLYWGILAMMIVVYFIVLVTKYYFLNLSLLKGSETVHQNMIESIVRCPGKFFDTTPSGVLINKFSNDLGILDNTMIFGLVDAMEGPIIILVAIVNVCQINVFFIIAAIILLIVAVAFFIYARSAIMACKQIDLQKKSPIFHMYSETISGLTQIKVYNKRQQKIQQFSQIINTSTKCAIGYDMVSRGFGFYQNLVSILMMAIGLLMGVALISAEDRGLYGITAVYLITICDLMQWILRQIILVESLMVSAERVLQFQLFEKEKELRTSYDNEIGLQKEIQAAEKQGDLHLEWPDQPSLEISNFSGKYDNHLPLVLKNLSISIKAKEKIGIVGRTGAGKSSIIQALFRIFQPEVGSQYTINGHDALQMGLHSLRQHISVIPQVPFLFKGSVRQNIDPFGTSSDEKLWDVLEESGLSEHVRGLDKKLDSNVNNISEAFSVGQKQLLCLSRALLRRNKFLVLDEATSNVDMRTDSFIQNVIKEKFTDTTVITIAHRLNTIADYDKVVVMKRGRIVEQGAPWQLIQRRGQFYDMVQHTGKSAETIMSKAKQCYEERLKVMQQDRRQ